MNNKERANRGVQSTLAALALLGGLTFDDYRNQEQSNPSSQEPTPITTTVRPSKEEASSLLFTSTVTPTETLTSFPSFTPTPTAEAIPNSFPKEGVVFDSEEGVKDEETKGPITYRVKKGDTLFKISKEHNNIPVDILYNMNQEVIGENPDLIKPGQELLIIDWGPVEASRDFARRKAEKMIKQGEKINWVSFTLNREMSIREIAEMYDVEEDKIISLNGIKDQTKTLPKDYYLMLPIDEGFAFTEADRKEGRRWQPMPGIPLGAIWWESPTGEKNVEPSYPNIAYTVIPCPVESWVDVTWSTADNLPADQFLPEEITNIPANRVWEIVDEKGNKRNETREGFLVHGKQKITHTGSCKIEAGKWISQ